MFDQPPFPDRERGTEIGAGAGSVQQKLGVVVPTRDRPERLARCLEALAAAREQVEFRAYVCDSSGAQNAAAVAETCRGYDFVELVTHDRVGASAARNVGTAACPAELIVAVDDDVYVEPDAIRALFEAAEAADGPAVVAGEVAWRHWHSRPLVMRRIGFGRDAGPGEEPEFLVSALILYPRRLALEFPWNERLWPYDDRYVTLIWRTAGARLVFAPGARARHDPIHSDYPVAHEADRIYVNALDAALVARSPIRFLCYELLSFAACAKKWARTPRGAWGLCVAWARGNAAVLRDRRQLRATIEAAERGAAPAAAAG